SDQAQARENIGLKALAIKEKVEIADIDATGTPSAGTFLRGDGAWGVAEAVSVADPITHATSYTVDESELGQLHILQPTNWHEVQITLPDASLHTGKLVAFHCPKQTNGIIKFVGTGGAA